jgi:hypothetical protein
MRLRGLVWIGVGVFLWIMRLVYGWPNLRWTNLPLGLVVIALGVGFLAYDAWARRREQPPEGSSK